MSQQNEDLTRKDKPPKRRNPVALPQSKASQPTPKKIKNNDKESIPQKSTIDMVKDFHTETMFATYGSQLSRHLIVLYGSTSMFGFNCRKQLFEAIPKYLFPLISQKRHKYFQSLKSIDFDLAFDRYDEKERSLINECFNQFSLLPFLRSLRFNFRYVVNQESFQSLSRAMPEIAKCAHISLPPL